MRYIRPSYFDDFKCIADKCPDTCCAGWQIMIDEASLEKYGSVKGDFGRYLRNHIDWQEGSFCQYDRRCAFLNGQNLCDLYTVLGSDALCDTCRNYPRHVEEYEGLREWSLSLSCPVAAEMILFQQNFPEFIEETDDKEDELEEEFEDFDVLLFTQLEDSRAAIMRYLQEGPGTLADKMAWSLGFAEELQDCIDREEYFALDDVIRQYENGLFAEQSNVEQSNYIHRKTYWTHLQGLERLRPEWTHVLEEMEAVLYARGETYYEECRRRFMAYLKKTPGAYERWEQVGLQLFVFFLYTYFCGAVYDDWIYSKMALAVESTCFIRELYMARWLVSGRLDRADYVALAYGYAREIEHSDQNLNALEEIFMELKTF